MSVRTWWRIALAGALVFGAWACSDETDKTTTDPGGGGPDVQDVATTGDSAADPGGTTTDPGAPDPGGPADLPPDIPACHTAAPPGAACNPYCQTGCTANQHCAVSEWELGCHPIGAGVDGDACTTAADCASELSCLEIEGVGSCWRPCGEDAHCLEGSSCTVPVLYAPGKQIQFCEAGLQSCDVFAQDCAASDKCVLVGGAPVCVPPSGDVGKGESCGGPAACQPGLLCVGTICSVPCSTADSPPPGTACSEICGPDGWKTLNVPHDIGCCR